MLSMLKMSKIDQIHLRAVMLLCQRCRRWEKNIQTHFYHNFLNMVLFECNAMFVEDVKDVNDRSNTPKGCNAI